MRPRNPESGAVSAWLVIVLALAAVLVLAVGLGAAWLYGLVAGPSGPADPVTVTIPSGAGSTEIASLLADADVVSSPLRFSLRARMLGADGEMKAGEYELSTNMPDELVIERLVAGPVVKTVTVTIPEGFTATQIAARLEEQAGVSAEEFTELASSGASEFAAEFPYLADAAGGSLEGFLFPKTYTFREGVTAREAVTVMLRQFDKEFATVDTSAAEQRGLSTYELVTIASMIEREARVAEERPLISSVIYNRLARGMRLQIDATIEYVLQTNRLRLRSSDLELDSPYNTYRVTGLPPTPISNPGLASLEAAAQPADTDYVFYVLTGTDGSHTFAETEAEFLEAKRRSKEVFGE